MDVGSIDFRDCFTSWPRLSKIVWIKSSVLSAVIRKKQNNISSVVSSPQVTRFGGDDGFEGFSAELS